MQQTANYNLNLPEGTDVVNPLVDYNPNFSTIDSAMKANADRTVGRATCIKSGTTHVVTRANPGSNIINFTATGDWNTGDTMTIDSTVVSVFLPDGSAALDGAYLINTEVFGILNGTRFTLYSNVVDIPAQTAANTSYDNTASGLTASDVQGAIDELENEIQNIPSGLEVAVVTGTTPNHGTEGSYAYPEGFTKDNTFVISIEVYHAVLERWYTMTGIYSMLTTSNIVINNAAATASFDGNPIKIMVAKQ